VNIYGVSRITAKRALDELASAGYATRERGKGTRVNAIPRGTIMKGSLASLIESQHANGRNDVEVLTFEYISASPAIADALNLKNGELVQRAVRVWRVEGTPFSHLETHVPASVGDNWSRADMQKRPMVQLLEESGIVIRRSEQFIKAVLANEDVARRLDVAPARPLLRVDRLNFDVFGNPVEHLVALYPEDRYTFRVTLTE
jgi:GntR family transcriptional regulator